MGGRIPVFVYGTDPVSQAGIVSQLRTRPEIYVVDDDVDAAQVAVVMVDEVDEPAVKVIRALQRNGCPRVILVAARLEDGGLMAAVEAGACGILRRHEAQPDRLALAVEAAAAGESSVPPDVLARLLSQVGQLQRQVLAPRGITLSGLTEREVQVLRLVAEGYDTSEIAQQLAYSERTIKNIVHDVTSRLNLRNRSHAVAYAVREGII